MSKAAETRMFVGGVLVLVGALLGGVAAQSGGPCTNGEEFSPHENCSLYYICAPGPIEQGCPVGLVFNPAISACDFAENVPECVGGTRPPIGPTTPTTPQTTTTRPTTTQSTTTRPSTTTTRPTTTTRATTTTRPTSPTETPETEGTPSTAGPTTLTPLQCDPSGIHKIRHPELCDSYYWCIDGELLPEVHSCPEGLLFDPQLRECNFEAVVQCDVPNPTGTTRPTTTTPPSTEFPECQPGESTVHPFPGNCTVYIVCVDGTMTFYMCPEKMLFDYVMRQCRPEEVAVCAPSSIGVKLPLAVEKLPLAVEKSEEGGKVTFGVSEEVGALRKLWSRMFGGFGA